MAARAPKALVAGNWKMNGLKDSESELKALMRRVKAKPGKCDVMICPPTTLVTRFATATAKSDVSIGGQDAHMNVSGAHTGDVSAQMLADAGASAVIVGHSERRADHGETDAVVKAKAQAVHAQKLTAIICVGETEEERDAGKALGVVGKQVRGSIPADATAKNTVVAYEPVWAIGTGRTPTAKDVEKVHGHIRKALVKKFGPDGEKMRILYGGSVKPANAVELMGVANVNGALVGGASLKAADFDGIIDAYRK